MKSCLIVGNGLSRNELPAADLQAMPSFGMNYCDFQPTYFVCIDTDVLLYHSDLVYGHAAGAEIAYLSALHEGSSILYDLPYVRLVSKDQQAFREEKYMSGFTAAYVALKQAYYLGFDTVHLWGVDHSPGWEHYRRDYPATCDHTTAARRTVMEWHYALAAEVYARAGRSIINHSHKSRLDMIFRRAEYAGFR